MNSGSICGTIILVKNFGGDYMNVQELFRQADPDRVAEAYFLQHDDINPNKKYSVDEKVDIAFHIKEQIREHIKRFSTCDIKTEESYTIFVIENLCDYYEDKGKTELYTFSINDNEAISKIQEKSTEWDDKGEDQIDNYGIDACKLEEVAGYSIAEECVRTLGVTACCMEILFELFWFGYTDEDREENLQKLLKEADESIEEIEERKSYSSTKEFFDEVWQELLDECEDDDERQHMILEKKYEDKMEDIEEWQKMKNIEKRYTHKVWEENHKKTIAIIRNEYLSR